MKDLQMPIEEAVEQTQEAILSKWHKLAAKADSIQEFEELIKE